MMFR